VLDIVRFCLFSHLAPEKVVKQKACHEVR